MGSFSHKEIYVEDGKRVLEVNILPEKYCNFDCIFCPVGRSQNKADEQKSFGDIDSSLIELGHMIENTKAELVFINSKGEALLNNKIIDIIAFIKSKSLPVRLLSNGYLLGKDQYRQIANMCDEVVGEIKVITEEDFQKLSLNDQMTFMRDHKFKRMLFKIGKRSDLKRCIFEIHTLNQLNILELYLSTYNSQISKQYRDSHQEGMLKYYNLSPRLKNKWCREVRRHDLPATSIKFIKQS